MRRECTPWRDRRLGGWILVETLIAVVVFALVVTTAAPLVATGIRGVGRSVDALQERLLTANAALAAYRLLEDGATSREVAAFLRDRYPTVEVVVTAEEIVVGGERLLVGPAPVDRETGGTEWNR